jgi:hypothetical protein
MQGDPVRSEPFGAFEAFPTDTLSAGTELWAAADIGAARLAEIGGLPLNAFGSIWRGTTAEVEAILERVRAQPGLRCEDLLSAFPPQRRRPIMASVLWLAKLGLLAWTPGVDLGERAVETF